MISNFENVDGLIIFHHEWKSLSECAKSFREFYPNGTLFIARDNLPMKHHLRLKEHNPIYIKTYSTTEFFLKMKFNDEHLEDISNLEFIDKVKQDLERMKETLSQCKNKYLLYMEADSKILSKTVITEEFDMDSLDANTYPTNVIDKIRNFSGTPFPLKGWGFVTGFIKVETGLKMIEWANKNENVLIQFFNLDRRFIYLDYFAPILMHLSGGKVIKSGKVGECLRDKKWRKRDYTLLHQYRIEYT